jgi:hypothetical protein
MFETNHFFLSTIFICSCSCCCDCARVVIVKERDDASRCASKCFLFTSITAANLIFDSLHFKDVIGEVFDCVGRPDS